MTLSPFFFVLVLYVGQVLELGIRASPAHGPLYRSWAQMEYQLGNTAAARRRFEQGLEACPTYTRLYYAYADMEAAMVRRRWESPVFTLWLLFSLGGSLLLLYHPASIPSLSNPMSFEAGGVSLF